MDKDWASRHLGKPVQYRDRAPVGPPRKPWGKIVGCLFVVGLVAGAAVSWKMGWLDAYLHRETPEAPAGDDSSTATTQLRNDRHTVTSSSPRAMAPSPAGPDQLGTAPSPTLDAKQREAILRGIDVQTRRRNDHQTLATALEAQIAHATAKLYPPSGSPKVDFDTYLRDQIRRARASNDSGLATNLELQLGDYRRKLQELRTKLAHERDIIASCTKLIDQEQAKLIP